MRDDMQEIVRWYDYDAMKDNLQMMKLMDVTKMKCEYEGDAALVKDASMDDPFGYG